MYSSASFGIIYSDSCYKVTICCTAGSKISRATLRSAIVVKAFVRMLTVSWFSYTTRGLTPCLILSSRLNDRAAISPTHCLRPSWRT